MNDNLNNNVFVTTCSMESINLLKLLRFSDPNVQLRGSVAKL